MLDWYSFDAYSLAIGALWFAACHVFFGFFVNLIMSVFERLERLGKLRALRRARRKKETKEKNKNANRE